MGVEPQPKYFAGIFKHILYIITRFFYSYTNLFSPDIQLVKNKIVLKNVL